MDERLIIQREVTRKQLAEEVYYITNAIMDTAEQMGRTVDEQPGARAEINASDLLVDIAGWAEQIKTLVGLARDSAFQLMN